MPSSSLVVGIAPSSAFAVMSNLPVIRSEGPPLI